MMIHPHVFPFLFFGPLSLAFLLVGFLIFALPVMEIIHKAGYSRIWILLWFIPIVNVVFLWIFAFSRWPSEKKN